MKTNNNTLKINERIQGRVQDANLGNLNRLIGDVEHPIDNVELNRWVSSDFPEIRYFDKKGKPSQKCDAFELRFETPYKTQEGDTIYGYYWRYDTSRNFMGINWKAVSKPVWVRNRERLYAIGGVSEDCWKRLADICMNPNLKHYGDYLVFPEIYYNSYGYNTLKSGETITKEKASIAVIKTNLLDTHSNPIIGWFVKRKDRWNGIEWGTEADMKYALKIKSTPQLGRFLFDNMDALNAFVSEVQSLLIPEPWDYSNNTSGRLHPILASYIACELDRLFYEKDELGRDDAIIYNVDRTEIYYSTNLLNKYGKDFCILGTLDKSKQYIKEYKLAPSHADLVRHGFPSNSEPAQPHFFNSIDEIIYHSEWMIDFDIAKDEHILEDRDFRFPEEYQNLAPHEKGQKLTQAIELAESIAKRNYKVIIPKYEPTKKSIQLLMPIYLKGYYCKEPDFALVLTPMEEHRENGEIFHYYKPETILEMKQAYNDARLIAEPSEPWLARTAIKKDE